MGQALRIFVQATVSANAGNECFPPNAFSFGEGLCTGYDSFWAVGYVHVKNLIASDSESENLQGSSLLRVLTRKTWTRLEEIAGHETSCIYMIASALVAIHKIINSFSVPRADLPQASVGKKISPRYTHCSRGTQKDPYSTQPIHRTAHQRMKSTVSKEKALIAHVKQPSSASRS